MTSTETDYKADYSFRRKLSVYQYNKVRTSRSGNTKLTLTDERPGNQLYIERAERGFTLTRTETERSIKQCEVKFVKGFGNRGLNYVNVHRIMPNGIYFIEKTKTGYSISWQDRPQKEELRYDRHDFDRIAINGLIRLTHESRDVYFGKGCRKYQTKYTCDIRNGFSLTLEQVSDNEYAELPRPIDYQHQYGNRHLEKTGIEVFSNPSSDSMYEFRAPSTFVRKLGKEINRLKFDAQPGRIVISREDYICPVCGETETWVDNQPDVIHLCPCCAKRLRKVGAIASQANLSGDAAIDYEIDWVRKELELKQKALDKMAELEAMLNNALSKGGNV